MSDYDDYSGDEDYANEDNWIYVEDHYDDADDLAEHTCASPALVASDLVHRDYDPFDFFEDLAYLSDAYQDEGKKDARGGSRDGKSAGSRRSKTSRQPPKSALQSPAPPVHWLSSTERCARFGSVTCPISGTTNISVEVVVDWQHQLKELNGPFASHRSDWKSHDDDNADADDEDEWEDDTGEAGHGEGSEHSDSAAVDLGDLQAIAGLLGEGDNLSALKEMLRARGIDSEALDVVLADLIAGREPEYASEDDQAEPASTEAEDAVADNGRTLTDDGAGRAQAHDEHQPAKRKRGAAESSSQSASNHSKKSRKR